MAGKTIYDYLPEHKKGEKKLVQANCGKELVNEAQKYMERDGITWRDLIEGQLKRYIEEAKVRKN